MLSAQTPYYKHYDVMKGLPSNEIYELHQDKKGFLWIGCDAGLVRYDGNKFVLFSNKQNRGPAVTCLKEDKKGRTWCSNFSGQIFYTQDDSLHLFQPWEKNYKNNFAEIAIDNHDFLYVTNFRNKMYRYNLKNNKEDIVVDHLMSKQFPFTAYNGEVIYTDLENEQVRNLSKNTNNLVPIMADENSPLNYTLMNNFVFYNSLRKSQTLAFERSSVLSRVPSLFYYENGKLILHPASAILKSLNVIISSCFYDDDGNLFVGTYSGLIWLKKTKSNQWILFNTSLPDYGISSILQDREGSIWVATLKNGLYQISNKEVWNISDKDLGIQSAGINHITSDGSSMLFGAATNGVVFSYNIMTGKSMVIPNPELRDVQALKYNPYTKQLFISKNGTYIYSLATSSGINISNISNNAKDFVFRNDGLIFNSGIGINTFFNKRKIKNRQQIYHEFDTLQVPANKLSSGDYERFLISDQRSKALWYQQDSKNLWVGYVDGLVRYENSQQFSFTDPRSGLPIIASSFQEAEDNTLYVATVEQGIYVIKNKKIVNHFNKSNRLLSNKIKKIKLAKNTLWIICSGSIQALDLITGDIRNITPADGLGSSEIFDIEIMKDTVFVASAYGLQFFPTSIKTRNLVKPVCNISKIEADDVQYSRNQSINLKYGTKNISFHLQGIALKSDGSFTYQYRLRPGETDWITVSANQNQIRFTSLAPGKYTFEAKAINEDGVASDDTTGLHFRIQKPWWQEWWFLLACFVLGLALVSLLYKSRLRLQKKKMKEDLESFKSKEELRFSQLASLKAQMNPHFMFNALNSIQEFILTNDKRQANMYMGKFADLMRITLDMSNKSLVSLEDEIKILNLYLELESLRFEEMFSTKISIAPNVNPSEIKLPAMLIQPYIENAVKHGLLHTKGKKKLTVFFKVENPDILSCIITDNGIGRKRSGEINAMRQIRHTSFATGATQKRLELLNVNRPKSIAVQIQDLMDTNGQPSGTRVTIKIPF